VRYTRGVLDRGTRLRTIAAVLVAQLLNLLGRQAVVLVDAKVGKDRRDRTGKGTLHDECGRVLAPAEARAVLTVLCLGMLAQDGHTTASKREQ